MNSPESELLLAIVKQAIRDYAKLDPDSDKVSAEYYIDEGQDYKTAEDFLFYEVPIPYGALDGQPLNLTFAHICCILDMDMKKIKSKIFKTIVEY